MKNHKILYAVATLVVGFIASCATPCGTKQCAEPPAPMKDGRYKVGEQQVTSYRPVVQKVTTWQQVETVRGGCGKSSTKPCASSGAKASDVRRTKTATPTRTIPKPAPAPPAKKNEKAPRSTSSAAVGKAEMAEVKKPCVGVSVVLNNSTVNINSGNGTVKATPVVDDIPSEEGDDRMGTTYFDAPLVE